MLQSIILTGPYFRLQHCSVGKGEKRDFMGKVYMSSKVVRSEGLG